MGGGGGKRERNALHLSSLLRAKQATYQCGPMSVYLFIFD